MLFKNNDCVIFFGDSITEAGRTKPAGEGALFDNPFGHGFVTMLYSKIKVLNPKLNLRFINQGVSGHRTYNLLDRMEQDVISVKPNWVVLMIGVNDAWRQFDFAQSPQFKMLDSDYENNCEKIIENLKRNHINVILTTPFVLETNHSEPLRAKIDVFAHICRKLAIKHELYLADTLEAFDLFIKDVSTHEISRDRVHVNSTGHMLIAETIYQTITKI